MDKKQSLLTFTALAVGTFIYNYLKPIKSSVDVISDFKIEKFLGEWQQIARLDNQKENNLINIKLAFLKNDNGQYHGTLTGYNSVKHNQINIESKIKLNAVKNLGIFKAAFFTPFYSNYNIVKVDESYQDILIFGNNLDRMWILSRTKEMPKERIDLYIQYAKDCGFDISNLVWNFENN